MQYQCIRFLSLKTENVSFISYCLLFHSCHHLTKKCKEAKLNQSWRVDHWLPDGSRSMGWLFSIVNFLIVEEIKTKITPEKKLGQIWDKYFSL